MKSISQAIDRLESLKHKSRKKTNKEIYRQIIASLKPEVGSELSEQQIAQSIVLLAEGRSRVKELKRVPGFFHTIGESRKVVLENLINNILKDAFLSDTFQAVFQQEIASFKERQDVVSERLAADVKVANKAVLAANAEVEKITTTTYDVLRCQYKVDGADGDMEISKRIKKTKDMAHIKQVELQVAQKACGAEEKHTNSVSKYLESIKLNAVTVSNSMKNF